MARTYKFQTRKGIDTKYKRYNKRQFRRSVKTECDVEGILPRRPISLRHYYSAPSDGGSFVSASMIHLTHKLYQQQKEDYLLSLNIDPAKFAILEKKLILGTLSRFKRTHIKATQYLEPLLAYLEGLKMRVNEQVEMIVKQKKKRREKRSYSQCW